MITFYDTIIYDNEYGRCAVRADSVEYDGIHVSYLEFEKTPKIKLAGGCYCLHCIETDVKKFYKNEYIMMHSINKFINDNLEIINGNCC